MLEATPRERLLDGASTSLLGIGGTTGLYVVFYSTAYGDNDTFWVIAGALGVLLLGLTLIVFTRKRPDDGLAPGTNEEQAEEQEGADEQDDGDDGHEDVDEGGEDHAADGAPALVGGAPFSQPAPAPAPAPANDGALTSEQRSAAYGALGGAVSALAVAALFTRRR